jgi:hypothetical protein
MNTLLLRHPKTTTKKTWTKPPYHLFGGLFIPLGTNYYLKPLNLLETHYIGATIEWVIYTFV